MFSFRTQIFYGVDSQGKQLLFLLLAATKRSIALFLSSISKNDPSSVKVIWNNVLEIPSQSQ